MIIHVSTNFLYASYSNFNLKIDIALRYIYEYMEALFKGALTALISYTTHYASVKFYDKACVPDGILGYLTGFVSAGSPVCQASLLVTKNTEVSYSSIITMSLTRIILDIVAPAIVKPD